jgi:ATP-dependent DNA ligase
VPVRLQLNEHIEEAGAIVFRHACRLGFEGIVSKRLGSPYISGRSRTWLKFKNPVGASGEARGGRRLGEGKAAVTCSQRIPNGWITVACPLCMQLKT